MNVKLVEKKHLGLVLTVDEVSKKYEMQNLKGKKKVKTFFLST